MELIRPSADIETAESSALDNAILREPFMFVVIWLGSIEY